MQPAHASANCPPSPEGAAGASGSTPLGKGKVGKDKVSTGDVGQVLVPEPPEQGLEVGDNRYLGPLWRLSQRLVKRPTLKLPFWFG